MKILMTRIVMMACIITAAFGCKSTSENEAPIVANVAMEKMKAKPINLEYGFNMDDFQVERGTVKKNETLSVILDGKNVNHGHLHALVQETKETFDLRRINVGKEYVILSSKEQEAKPEFFIYKNDKVNYTVFSLADTVMAYQAKKPVETVVREAHGIVNSSLYQTMMDNGLSANLAMELADMYAWTIDFYRIQKGDNFKVIFEENLVDGESVGINKILAANFEHNGEDNYGYFFAQGEKQDYYDADGESLRKAFLKSPVKFSRLSSRYNKKRFHPVLKRVKAHLGTDYAAAHGTPILAVGDGVVSKSSYTNGNGKYVKIRHNGTYDTQYLHMSKRAVKVGEKVHQGDVIGYVGSTGLATGPHVCFRFWKNGIQVDHLKEKFPSADPITAEFEAAFNAQQIKWQAQLDLIGNQKDNPGILATIVN